MFRKRAVFKLVSSIVLMISCLGWYRWLPWKNWVSIRIPSKAPCQLKSGSWLSWPIWTYKATGWMEIFLPRFIGAWKSLWCHSQSMFFFHLISSLQSYQFAVAKHWKRVWRRKSIWRKHLLLGRTFNNLRFVGCQWKALGLPVAFASDFCFVYTVQQRTLCWITSN